MGTHEHTGGLTRVLGAMAVALLLSACGEESSGVPAPAATDTTVAVNSEVAAPAISGAPAEAVSVGEMYVFQPSASDPTAQPMTFSAQGLPAWATLDAGNGRISGTPADADAGESADIIVAVTNGKTQAALPAFRVKVNPRPPVSTNVPGSASPVISGTPATTATAGTAWAFTPTASDADTLALTFSVTNKPVWAAFSSSTGALSGTPASAQVGTYANIVIRVSDGSHQVNLPAFTVQVVAPANAAPTIAGAPATSVAVGAAYSFTPVAADPEKQALGFSIANKPAWASFNTATGALTGSPAAANVGSFSNIVIRVSDGTTQTSLAAFAITVTAAPNGQPTIAGAPSTVVKVGAAYSFQPTAQDPNGDALTWSITGKPAWASFSTATGALTGTPAAGDQGSFANIVVSVSDGKASASLAPFSILVNATTTGSATLSWSPPTQNTDGSTLTNLSGYRIYYGTNESALSSTIQVTNAGLTSYTVGNLGPGTYYFAIAAYTSDGVEGSPSAVGSKTIM